MIHKSSSSILISLFNFFLLYDWRESCFLIGPICLHKSLCVPGNWSKPVHKLILHENQLKHALNYISLVSTVCSAEPDQTPQNAASDLVLHCCLQNVL